MSNGKVIIIVGEMGSGKTTYIKNFSSRLKDKQTLIYLRLKDDYEGKKVKKFTNFMDFINQAKKSKDTLLLIDEAFTCLPKQLTIKMNNPSHPHNKLADMLVNTRKMNNFLFIILHSLKQIPTEWLLDYCDYLVRFNTKDKLQYQINRFETFPNIVESLEKIPKLPKYKSITLKLR